MKPCLNPQICGVQNHRNQTVCAAESAGAKAASASDFGAPKAPTSGNKRLDHPFIHMPYSLVDPRFDSATPNGCMTYEAASSYSQIMHDANIGNEDSELAWMLTNIGPGQNLITSDPDVEWGYGIQAFTQKDLDEYGFTVERVKSDPHGFQSDGPMGMEGRHAYDPETNPIVLFATYGHNDDQGLEFNMHSASDGKDAASDLVRWMQEHQE